MEKSYWRIVKRLYLKSGNLIRAERKTETEGIRGAGIRPFR